MASLFNRTILTHKVTMDLAIYNVALPPVTMWLMTLATSILEEGFDRDLTATSHQSNYVWFNITRLVDSNSLVSKAK